MPEPAPAPPENTPPIPDALKERLENPFKGLAYFNRDDDSRFGGRDRDVRAVASGVLKSRTFVVYGRSGLGKTSLMLAGVFPELERHACRTIYVRALADPVEDLRAALRAQLDGGDPHGGPAGDGGEPPAGDGGAEQEIRDLIDRHDNEGPVVVLFDQFEEFFIRFTDRTDAAGGEKLVPSPAQRLLTQARRKEFIRLVGRLAGAAELNLRLVFSLREDWVAEMHAFSSAVPEIQEDNHRLLPLSAFGVRQSILRMLKASGVDFDAGLISALIESLSEVQFDPAVLQVVASEVWKRGVERSAGGTLRLSLADLEAVGGVWGVFEGYLEQVTRLIPEDDQRRRIQVRGVLDSLITRQRTKRAVKPDFFLEQYFAVTAEEVEDILETLAKYRLVRRDHRGGEDWYELVHERLVETILSWLDTDLDFFRLRSARNLVVNSCGNPGWQENPGLLLTREQLDETVGPYKEYLQFTPEEKLFLISSATYNESTDLEYWIDYCGFDRSAELVERFLADEANVVARRRAAGMVHRLRAPEGELVERCLGLALDDADPEVRHYAGWSFAHLASESHLRRLADRVEKDGWPSAAGDTMALLVAAGKMPEGIFRRRDVLRARRRDFGRRVKANRSTLSARGRMGLRAGYRAGITWTFTLGLLLVLFALRELEPGPFYAQIPHLATRLLGYLIAVVPVSAFVGWRAAVGAGKEAIFSGHEGRFDRAIASRTMLIASAVISLPGLIAFLFLLPSLLSDSGEGFQAACVMAITLPLLVIVGWFALSGKVAQIAKPLFWPVRELNSALWIWLWAVGAGLFLPACVWTFVDRLVPEDWSWMADLAVPIGLASGLVIFVASRAIVLSSPGWSASYPESLRLGTMPSTPTAAMRRRRRVAALALNAAVVLLVLHANGLDSLPFTWKSRVVGQEPVDVDFGSAPVDTRRIELVPPPAATMSADAANPWRNGLTAVRLVIPPELDDSSSLALHDPTGDVTSGQILFVPPAGRPLVVTGRDLDGVDVGLVFERVAAESGQLPRDDWQVLAAELTAADGSDVWTGRLTGRAWSMAEQPEDYALFIRPLALRSDRCPGRELEVTFGVPDVGVEDVAAVDVAPDAEDGKPKVACSRALAPQSFEDVEMLSIPVVEKNFGLPISVEVAEEGGSKPWDSWTLASLLPWRKADDSVVLYLQVGYRRRVEPNVDDSDAVVETLDPQIDNVEDELAAKRASVSDLEQQQRWSREADAVLETRLAGDAERREQVLRGWLGSRQGRWATAETANAFLETLRIHPGVQKRLENTRERRQELQRRRQSLKETVDVIEGLRSRIPELALEKDDPLALAIGPQLEKLALATEIVDKELAEAEELLARLEKQEPHSAVVDLDLEVLAARLQLERATPGGARAAELRRRLEEAESRRRVAGEALRQAIASSAPEERDLFRLEPEIDNRLDKARRKVEDLEGQLQYLRQKNQAAVPGTRVR